MSWLAETLRQYPEKWIATVGGERRDTSVAQEPVSISVLPSGNPLNPIFAPANRLPFQRTRLPPEMVH
jgi:hypothetical protein